MIRAEVVISEAGRQSLACSGLALGWIKAWLQAAGADACRLLPYDCDPNDSDRWWHSSAEWQLLLFAENEWETAPVGVLESTLLLNNPPRSGYRFRRGGGRIGLFIPCGDLAGERELWLPEFGPSRPLHIYGEGQGALPLEPGLSASLVDLGAEGLLNRDGLLPEEQLLQRLRQLGWQLRLAESCTSGAIAARVGRIAGASAVLDRGVITYSNAAKSELVSVAPALIERHGAVSCEVVEAMATGARAGGQALAIAVSGIAGPGGGSGSKPVGTVWIAAASPDGVVSQCWHFKGSRNEVQSRATVAALLLAIRCVGTSVPEKL